MSEKAVLCIGDQKVELPILEGTQGEKAIDISRLREATGLVTYDPSLANTAACQSAITYIDGDQGILRYRGIPIEQFTFQPNFVEAAWLLIFGRLPKKDELTRFSELLTENELLHDSLKHQFQHLPPDAPPMAILSATLSNLACYHQEFLTFEDEGSFEEAAARLISKVRTIAAFSYRRSQGLPFIYPDPKLRYCANFLHMMFSIPYQQYEVTPEVEDALNLIFILHADHEQNCSTSTVRMVGSARANLFASCAAGVCALWGPLHGGANVEVMQMLEQIHRGGMSAEECIRLAKDKTNPFRLFGFGHRIYKNYDPRAKILKEACDKVFEQAEAERSAAGHRPEARRGRVGRIRTSSSGNSIRTWTSTAASSSAPSASRPTCSRCCSAIGRLPGWIAHWKEQHDDPTTKIMRPRQVYVGPGESEYVLMANR